MIDYTIERSIVQYGLTPTLLILAVIVAVQAVPTLRKDTSLTEAGKLVLPGIFMLALPPMIVMGIGPALLSISGVVLRFLDGQLNVDFFRQELLSGALALRLSSVVITYHLATLSTQKTWSYLDYTSKAHRSDPEVRKQFALHLSSFQYLFYGLCAACLWQHYLFNSHAWLATLLSWGVIYILDDWGIISNYLIRRDVLPARFLYYKIAAFNILLAVVSLTLFFDVGHWIFLWFYTIPMVAIGANWFGLYAVMRQRALEEHAWM